MINDREIIKGYTNGLEPGKLYISDLNHPICYLAESEKGVLFDTNTYNVHMCPLYDKKENRKIIEQFCNDTNKLRVDIIEKIKEKLKGQAEEVGRNEFENSIIKNDNVLYIYKRSGQSGELFSLRGTDYATENLNHMFRFIPVRKNGNTYYLNFMRFFVANQKINCILRQYQYDCKLRRRVKYPTISEGQKLSDWGKTVLENSRVEEFYYNPEVKFNESSVEKVAKSFLEFINFCDEKFQ